MLPRSKALKGRIRLGPELASPDVCDSFSNSVSTKSFSAKTASAPGKGGFVCPRVALRRCVQALHSSLPHSRPFHRPVEGRSRRLGEGAG